MVRTLLVCGLVAGALAGVLTFGFDTVAGEPAVDQAIAYEEANAAPAAPGAREAPVSRGTQRGVGLLTASLAYGLAVGGIFALVFTVAYGRVGQGRAGPGLTALALAAGAFVVVYLAPFVKYPPNPPAVGDPATIGQRTALYVAMVAVSIAAAVAAWRLRRLFARRRAPEAATALGVMAYLAIVTIAGLALPAGSEIPASFPATILYEFRLASVGTQLVLWATIGSVFAFLARRVMNGQRLPAPLGGLTADRR